MEKEKPVAKCTRCGTTTINDGLTNQRCLLTFVKRNGNKTKSVRCNGVYRGMLLSDDWRVCSDCSGEGNNCTTCRDAGWISTRRI